MSKFHDFIIERRRGALLCALASAAAGTEADALLLQRYCLAIGMRPTLDAVAADLRWLAERALVQLGGADGRVAARITQAGREVAAGRAAQAGVDVADESA